MKYKLLGLDYLVKVRYVFGSFPSREEAEAKLFEVDKDPEWIWIDAFEIEQVEDDDD